MMTQRIFLLFFLGMSFLFGGGVSAHAAETEFLAFCYHDVQDSNPDQTYNGLSTSRLVEQLSWLQHEGYTSVTLDDVLAARDGGKPLPPKAVLLSFDDGYESFYTRVYPILQAFQMHALVAVVDSWMKGAAGTQVMYGGTALPRENFLTWAQIREMEKSGLVETVSHSDAMHQGVAANPQGNTEASGVTSIYNPTTKRYEDRAAYEKRLAADLRASAATIQRETGHRPRAVVWPYGAYNQLTINAAAGQGISLDFTLEDGVASMAQLMAVPRQMIKDDPELGTFVSDLREIKRPKAQRVVQVDLDYVYDPDPAQLARNLDALIARVHAMQVSTVFLQAFANPEGDGLAKSLYFPNRVMPMRSDLFNRVVWQLKTRAHVRVYGWLPVLSYDFGGPSVPTLAWDEKTGTVARDPHAYQRVSLFDPESRHRILDLYEDMARHAPIDGILFHDDALLSDFEDASAPAVQAYKAAGFPASVEAIRANPDSLKKWTDFKTEALIAFTKELTDRVKLYRQPIKTVRNIYAPVVLQPESAEWFAQDYDRFLQAYDYTAIMAMPEMENVSEGDAHAWLDRLVAHAKQRPQGLDHTIFELQAVDWRKESKGEDRALDTAEVGARMRLLEQQGALNFGYYPDDFVTNTPDADVLHKDFSLQTYAYTP